VTSSVGPQNLLTCFLCAINMQERASLPWYDRPLMEAQGVGIAVAGVGAFVPGYTIVASSLHVSSVQSLPKAMQGAFDEFVSTVVDKVQAYYGEVTLFEHGSCGDTQRRRSACIEHAHIQILPGSYSLTSLGLRIATFASIAEFLRAEGIDGGYLMYREPGGPVCYAEDVGVSQFFRRHIARRLGVDEEWDYALFPRWDSVRRTHETLRTMSHVVADIQVP
jgi:hypothetical protein